MNDITPAKQTLLPIVPAQPAARPPVAASAAAGEYSNATHKQPSTYVYRGEILEAAAEDRRYRPHYNQQIDPQNRRAIDSYQRVSAQSTSPGRILDFYL